MNSVERDTYNLSTANGETLKVFGKTLLYFEIDETQLELEFLVAEIDELHAILGQDFLERYDATIKFGRAIMQIGKQNFRLLRYDCNKSNRIRLENSFRIQPNTEVTINAKIDGVLMAEVGVIEPYPSLSKRGLLVARGVLDPIKREIPICFINIKDNPIKLKRNMAIGSVQIVTDIKETNQYT